MNNSEKDIILIEQYLSGEVEEDQKTEIEARLNSDQDFKDLHDDMAVLFVGIKRQSSKEVLQQLKELSKTLPEIPDQNVTPFFQKRGVLAIAASISVLIIASLFIIRNLADNKSNKLFDTYFEVYPNQVVPLSRSSRNDQDKAEQAYYAYEIGEYVQAITLLKELPVEQDNGASLFYIGLCYLSVDDPQQSIVFFKQYLKDYSTFENQVKWYLALSYVKTASNKETISTLSAIPERSSYYNKAQSLIEELNIELSNQ